MVKSNSKTDISLVVGDAHIDPSQLSRDGLRRFRWLDSMITDKNPNRLILMGDFTTMQSLSRWDKDKRRVVEGRRLEKDFEAANAALDCIYGGAMDKIYIKGNHEDWFEQYIDYHPEMEGVVDFDTKLHLKDRGYTVVPYKEDWKHKGVSFTHVPIQANGKPVAGKNATQRALDVYSNSVVFGHTHNFDVAAVHRKNSPSLQQAINCGCFFEHVDDYAQGSMTNYWRGVLLLNHYDTNRVDIEQWSMGRLRREYG